jgi:hypothetical protein
MKQAHTEVRTTFNTTSRQDSTLLGHQDVFGGRLALLLMATQQSNLRVVSLTCVLINVLNVSQPSTHNCC